MAFRTQGVRQWILYSANVIGDSAVDFAVQSQQMGTNLLVIGGSGGAYVNTFLSVSQGTYRVLVLSVCLVPDTRQEL